MNWDVVKGQWHQVKGSVKAQWGRLTDDELEQVAGEHEKLVGLLQERYGLARDEAERQVDNFNWTIKH
ncbi:CsbD family protein [Methylomagnum ishizawai]|uniref:CsbD family protein n=1 Tax=Methylomagnum ishizawai TaxID=1760988 RepID=UPI001C338F56|nr:CsbD family protein [Methylomagnum ishizawai]BBL77394.1 CsbD family protein [Methylomagnum ishizawai]